MGSIDGYVFTTQEHLLWNPYVLMANDCSVFIDNLK